MVNVAQSILRPRQVEKHHLLQTVLRSKTKYYGQHGKSKIKKNLLIINKNLESSTDKKISIKTKL